MVLSEGKIIDQFEESWRRYFERARAARRSGDLLLLADEAPTEAFRIDAQRAAAEVSARQVRPRQVLLFSGHMVDAPGREPPRFPSTKVPLAARAIEEALAALDAGAGDLALTQGACGGDLLFTEACLRRAVAVHWLQPFAEPEFIAASVSIGGEEWLHRYRELRAALGEPPSAAAEVLGPPPERGRAYPYERCNLWLLYSALAFGADKICLLCLWDGSDGDGPGGTAQMVREVERRGGRIVHIDPRKL